MRNISYRIPKRRLFSTTVPLSTRTYKAVTHKELAKATLKGIKDAGFELETEEYYCAKDGDVATARYTIKDVRDEDMQLEIGWQNSYDKTLSLKFAIGTRIFICSNGCVSGNFGSFARKHVADVQDFAPKEMKNAILSAAATFTKMVEEKDIMKRHYIGRERQQELAGRLFFTNRNFNLTRLNLLYDEFRKPSHEYGAPGSIWEIYQFVTFTIKEMNPALWMETHISVHDFFLKEIDDSTERREVYEDAQKWRTTLDIDAESGILDEIALLPLGPVADIDDSQVDLEDSIAEVLEEKPEDYYEEGGI
jgi:hypothetical protein